MLPPVEESVPPEGAYRSDEVIPRTEEAPLVRRPPARWSRGEIIAIVAITLIAAIIRLVNLADPPEYVFDEVYYAKDGCVFAEKSSEVCGIPDESTQVHPPLGKAIISIGITAFGFDSFGWRIMATLAGSLSVALLFLIARRLFASLVAASAAALLLALDFLHFVQSRVAMLDIFLVLFGLLAFYFALLDRAALMRRLDERNTAHRNPFFRPWRMAAGAAAGAAAACKWPGVFVLLAIIVLSIAWEKGARAEVGERSSLGRVMLSESPSIFLWLLLLPVVTYAASYAGHLEGDLLVAPWEPGAWLRNLWERQQYMWDFHKDLSALHSYQSPSWSWLAIKRPVSYFFCAGAEGPTACNPPTAADNYEEIIALGNPFVWWSSLIALLYVGVAWLRSRDWRRPEGLILGGFLLTFLPWLVPASDRSATFIFYLLPSLPFMCLALGYGALRLGRSWEARTAITVFAAASIALFAFYYPVMAKRPLPRSQWEQRITPHFEIFGRTFTLFADCEKPPGETIQVTSTITENGKETVTSSPSTKDYEGPPSGWCWI